MNHTRESVKRAPSTDCIIDVRLTNLDTPSQRNKNPASVKSPGKPAGIIPMMKSTYPVHQEVLNVAFPFCGVLTPIVYGVRPRTPNMPGCTPNTLEEDLRPSMIVYSKSDCRNEFCSSFYVLMGICLFCLQGKN